jgi:transcriptional regulator with XRE-family HTH domain
MLARFSRNLLALRERAGISQGELAERVGLHHTQISKFENGRRAPRLPTIFAIADALGAPVTALFVGSLRCRAAGDPARCVVDREKDVGR